MQQFTTVDSVRAQVKAWREQGDNIALVPTMGNLHEGHFKLVDEARQHCERVIVSIFVNPTQFGPTEDFQSYPRTLEADAEGLRQRACAGIFSPSVAELYPSGQESTCVEVQHLSEGLCGEFRPGHFVGVATVVTKLLQAVMPDQAFFGEKDYQQLLVVQRLATDLLMPVKIIGCPTVREADGLAMSSRNQYLEVTDRLVAAKIYQTLLWIRETVESQTDLNLEDVCAQARLSLEQAGMTPDYVEIRRAKDLKPISNRGDAKVALIAAQLGAARLIDNLRW